MSEKGNVCPSEHVEQREFVSLFRRHYPGVLIFAIPNGGMRDKVTGAKLKLEGVIPGVPDLFVPEWDLWIEMKRERGAYLSHDQKEIIERLKSIGHSVIVGRGCDDAMDQVDEFLINRL